MDSGESSDPEGESLIYLWTRMDTGESHNEKIWDLGVIPPTYSPIKFYLIVTDDEGATDEDSVTVEFRPLFTTNDDGTVLDGFGKMWMRDHINHGIWAEQNPEYDPRPYDPYYSLAHLPCEHLEFAGHSDWRNPTAEELRSLFDSSFGPPSINMEIFYSTESAFYITSKRQGTTGVYAINFGLSEPKTQAIQADSEDAYSRCVRTINN